MFSLSNEFAYRKNGTGNACAGHSNVIDPDCNPDWIMILFPDNIFGMTLPTGSK